MITRGMMTAITMLIKTTNDLSLHKNKLTTHPVKVSVRILWHVVIENNVDSFDVHSTAK